MSPAIRESLDHCENAVKAGRLSSAATLLSTLPLKEIPRELFSRMANLCRRTNQIDLGLRLLTPIIHPKTVLPTPATTDEIAEYAVLLQRSGGVLEALRLLESLGTRAPIEAHLYRAYCHFSRWDYAKAIPDLDAYLAADLAPYKRTLGEVNLASALVAIQDDERAFKTLEGLLRHTQNTQRLHGNCLEMRAQLEIRAGRFNEAARSLDQALEILNGGWDRLFVEKWQSFLCAKQTGDMTPLLFVRKKAVELKHFETQREVDLLALLIQFDEKRFHHLYFGSPLEGYRSRLLKTTGHQPTCESYTHGADGTQPLDFNESGKLNHLLRILSRDLYRPATLGALFAELFPDEYFDIFHSPNRVHQLIRRARRHLEKEALDLQITNEDGNFQLQLGPGAAVTLSLNESPSDSHENCWRRLQAEFTRDATFTAKEARQRLGLSEGQFRRFAIWAQERGHLHSGGAGSATIYQINSNARVA